MACLALFHIIQFCFETIPVDNTVKKAIAADMLQSKSVF